MIFFYLIKTKKSIYIFLLNIYNLIHLLVKCLWKPLPASIKWNLSLRNKELMLSKKLDSYTTSISLKRKAKNHNHGLLISKTDLDPSKKESTERLIPLLLWQTKMLLICLKEDSILKTLSCKERWKLKETCKLLWSSPQTSSLSQSFEMLWYDLNTEYLLSLHVKNSSHIEIRLN